MKVKTNRVAYHRVSFVSEKETSQIEGRKSADGFNKSENKK